MTDTIGIGAARPVGSGTVASRRDLLSLIGTVAGSAAMYHAMSSLGFASDSSYKGPIALGGDVRGASVLILGAGLAGMTAAAAGARLTAHGVAGNLLPSAPVIIFGGSSGRWPKCPCVTDWHVRQFNENSPNNSMMFSNDVCEFES